MLEDRLGLHTVCCELTSVSNSLGDNPQVVLVSVFDVELAVDASMDDSNDEAERAGGHGLAFLYDHLWWRSSLCFLYRGCSVLRLGQRVHGRADETALSRSYPLKLISLFAERNSVSGLRELS